MFPYFSVHKSNVQNQFGIHLLPWWSRGAAGKWNGACRRTLRSYPGRTRRCPCGICRVIGTGGNSWRRCHTRLSGWISIRHPVPLAGRWPARGSTKPVHGKRSVHGFAFPRWTVHRLHSYNICHRWHPGRRKSPATALCPRMWCPLSAFLLLTSRSGSLSTILCGWLARRCA